MGIDVDFYFFNPWEFSMLFYPFDNVIERNLIIFQWGKSYRGEGLIFPPKLNHWHRVAV